MLDTGRAAAPRGVPLLGLRRGRREEPRGSVVARELGRETTLLWKGQGSERRRVEEVSLRAGVRCLGTLGRGC